MTDKRITTRTELPPPEILLVRSMSRRIARAQGQNPATCYLHLKQWRNYRGITLREAATRIGVSLPTYRNWDDNRNWPVSEHLPVIADTFGCCLEELFYPPPGMRQ